MTEYYPARFEHLVDALNLISNLRCLDSRDEGDPSGTSNDEIYLIASLVKLLYEGI